MTLLLWARFALLSALALVLAACVWAGVGSREE
jgi:hypothetical protein